MDSFGAARKRGMPDADGGSAGSKRTREAESIQPGLGRKSKPCTKFFSTAGCQFGESCHFQHYVPGGFNVIAQMTNLGNHAPAPPRSTMVPHGIPEAPHGAIKTRMCSKYNTAEGCRFGEKCHFAHGERELGKPLIPSYDNGPVAAPTGGRFAGRFEQPPPASAGVSASFGASATAKISVDASLAGAIIGKGGANTKHIYRLTGVKLHIKDHESDTNQKNIELEGTFDQIGEASAMVKELIMNITATMMPHPVNKSTGAPPRGPGNNLKTKMCENLAKGHCKFADQCNFAHSQSELRKYAA